MIFKLRFKPSTALGESIEKNSSDVKTMVKEIDKYNAKLDELFATLKEGKKQLTKLEVKQVKLKETSPKMVNLHKKNEEMVVKLNLSVEKHVKKFLSVLDKIILKLWGITFDADTLLYREDKSLTKLANEVNKITDKRLKHKLLVFINHVKANMKSITLKLLEASKLEEEEVMVYPGKRKLTSLPERVKDIGAELRRLEEIPGKLSKAYVSELLKAATAQINRLKKIELDVLVIMPAIDRHFAKLRDKMYILEDSIAKKTTARIDFYEKKFEYVKNKIAKQAENLFETIELVGEK